MLALLRLWLWVSALASLAGWSLSLAGQLNRLGYCLFACCAVVLAWLCRKWLFPDPGRHVSRWKKFARRFRAPLPFAFALLAFLVLLGGLLYSPSNHTAITYRLPRVLQWLAEGRWNWIHSINYRMNDRACGIEWLTAPILLFTKSDRLLFLLNFFPFLLMPGLIFSLFRRLGINSRVAWRWMWLLPAAYNFLLQAGSTANDTFPTVYALAAMDFAFRARETGRFGDLCNSLLAVALLTGAKASNLPLLLPWALLFVPLLPLALKWPLHLLPVLLLAAVVSFLPTAALNYHYCHDWSGLNLERAGMNMQNPFVGIWGNSCLFLVDNLVPPFFPAAGWWNQNVLTVLPTTISGPLVANFEAGFHTLGELPTEDWVGIGFGVSWLLVLSLIAPRPARCAPRTIPGRLTVTGIFRWCVLLAPWLALLAYSMKSGMATGARLISPYYPLLLPLLLCRPGLQSLVRTRWWRVAELSAMAIAIPVVALTPARPLWPATTVLQRLATAHPQQKLLSRAFDVYSVYAGRADPLARVRALLPPDLDRVGFMARGDDPDISFWRPFGSRRVVHLLVQDQPAFIKSLGLRYAIVGDINFSLQNTSFEEWRNRVGAELVSTVEATVKVSEGPQRWYIVRFSN